MSDERDLTPEQEARVARLLADARVDEPMPPDVAARLDRVLAGLSGEPVAPPEQHHAPVVDLAARRRRRVRNLLAAAAAVVVVGVGIGQLVGSQDFAEDAGDGGGEGAVAESDNDSALENTPLEAAPAPGRHDEMTQQELRGLGEPPRITTNSFAADVRRLQDRAGVRTNATSGYMDGDDLAARGMGFTCGGADFGSGKLIAVRYNGSPAVLAYRPASGETQTVDLLQCGSGDVLRSTTVPLP
jgi:hypothetical protein